MSRSLGLCLRVRTCLVNSVYVCKCVSACMCVYVYVYGYERVCAWRVCTKRQFVSMRTGVGTSVASACRATAVMDTPCFAPHVCTPAQADCLKNGSAKKTLNLLKKDLKQLWEGMKTGACPLHEGLFLSTRRSPLPGGTAGLGHIALNPVRYGTHNRRLCSWSCTACHSPGKCSLEMQWPSAGSVAPFGVVPGNSASRTASWGQCPLFASCDSISLTRCWVSLSPVPLASGANVPLCGSAS